MNMVMTLMQSKMGRRVRARCQIEYTTGYIIRKGDEGEIVAVSTAGASVGIRWNRFHDQVFWTADTADSPHLEYVTGGES